MSFSYNPSLSRPLDRVRFMLQDTCEEAVELQDEEIEALYSLTPTDADDRVLLTAYECAVALYRRYSKLVTISADGSSMQFTARAKQWGEVLGTLQSLVSPAWSQVIQTARHTELVADYLPVGTVYRTDTGGI